MSVRDPTRGTTHLSVWSFRHVSWVVERFAEASILIHGVCVSLCQRARERETRINLDVGIGECAVRHGLTLGRGLSGFEFEVWG